MSAAMTGRAQGGVVEQSPNTADRLWSEGCIATIIVLSSHPPGPRPCGCLSTLSSLCFAADLQRIFRLPDAIIDAVIADVSGLRI